MTTIPPRSWTDSWRCSALPRIFELALKKDSIRPTLCQVFSTVLCLAAATGCRPGSPPPNTAPLFRIDPAAFDQNRAFQEVEALLDLGPRESGTEGAERAALHIHDRLTAVGCEAEIDRFLNQTPRGEVTFRNVMARIPGSGTAEWLIGGHYDTKSGISDTFVGANDSGSSTGVLIELARLAAEAARVAPPNVGLLFVVFDGEEAMESYGKTDGFHGSRHLADRWVREKRIQHLRAVIILDMIGDADLNITIPKNCDRGLVKRLFESAHAQGVRPYFELFEGTILDDHSAFQAAGVPAVDLIDFEFGSSAGLNDYWHTDQDTLDHISPQSLGIVGRVTIEMINRHSIQ